MFLKDGSLKQSRPEKRKSLSTTVQHVFDGMMYFLLGLILTRKSPTPSPRLLHKYCLHMMLKTARGLLSQEQSIPENRPPDLALMPSLHQYTFIILP